MENQNPEEKKDYQYVYFIENHLHSEPATIDFSQKYVETGELEPAEQKLYEHDQNFRYTIYRFKLFNSKIEPKKKKTLEIIIQLEDKDEKKFESRIYINDFSRDIFIYGFRFDKSKEWINVIEPPIFFPFNLTEEFEIYINYIRKVLKKNKILKKMRILFFHLKNY